MSADIDLTNAPRLEWQQFAWFMRQNLPAEVLADLMEAVVVYGTRAADGRLDLDPKGPPFIVFDQGDDLVFWNPDSGELATWNGRAFALGESAIISAATYAFDNYLVIHADPLDWLRDLHGSSVVVLDWSRAFDKFRDAPRIAIAEELLSLYRQHMKPARMPQLAVLTGNRRIAA